MVKTNPASCKHKHSKWLLSVILFLGLFCVSGNPNNCQTGPKQIVKTELVSVYREASKLFNSRDFATFLEVPAGNDFSKNNVPEILLLHNKLSKTKFDALKRIFITNSTHFLLIKAIPQSQEKIIMLHS